MAGLAQSQRALGLAAPARRSLEDAERTAAQPQTSERDRHWVHLAVVQQRAIDASAADADVLAREYRRAIETYVRAYPRDPDGFVLRGDASSGPAGQGQTGGQASLRWYRAALALAPDHPAAHHHLAHSLENLGRPTEALDYARRFASLTPAAPHALHLVGHLLPPLGRWHEAIQAFEQADRLHRRRFEREQLTAEYDWHFGHNLHLLAAARWHLGETSKAEALWRRAFLLRETGPRAGALCLPWLELMLLEGRDDDALDGARECARRDSDAARAIGRAVEGEVMVARGDAQAARAMLAMSEEAIGGLSDRASRLPAAAVALEAAVRTTRSLEVKIALSQSDATTGEDSFADLARQLAAQSDFDAWSSGLLRLSELERYAGSHGHPQLAERIAGLRSTLPSDGPGQ